MLFRFKFSIPATTPPDLWKNLLKAVSVGAKTVKAPYDFWFNIWYKPDSSSNVDITVRSLSLRTSMMDGLMG